MDFNKTCCGSPAAPSHTTQPDYTGSVKTSININTIVQFKQPVYNTTTKLVWNSWECQLPLLDVTTNKTITITDDGSPLPASITKLTPPEVRVSSDNGATWFYKII